MQNKSDFMKLEGDSFPGYTYVQALLRPVFNFQRTYLFDVMIRLNQAHTIMLQEQDLLTLNDAKAILSGLKELSGLDPKQLEYDSNYEDLFFMMESRLGEKIGDELAGKMHIARSRNDMGEGMYRLVIRDYLLQLIQDADELAEALLEQAECHVSAVMPAHTHTQPAQPTTFGHYLTAIFDQLKRDQERLWHAYETVNHSPLGAAAITTTGFSISRNRLMELLGFDRLIENSYDAIGTGDYLLEAAQAIVSLMVNTGRWVQEMLRFTTREVGLLKVADPYVQISSIMPQKRNPVSLEHSRAIASSAMGNAMSVIHMLHNTPYGDINDTEDDLQPVLYESFQKASRVLHLLYAVMRTAEFDVDRAGKQARENLITITELADVLTRDHGLAFRKAHGIASAIAKESLAQNKELYEWTAAEINTFLDGVQLADTEWKAITDPVAFVERRTIQGGPNPDEVKRMIHERHARIQADQAVLRETRKKLYHADGLLVEQIRILTD